jgi:hypothetical protein
MSLPVPASCSLQMVDDVVAERQGGPNAAFFSLIAPTWREKVEEYIAKGGSPEFIEAWPAVDHKRETFLNLYVSPALGSVQRHALGLLRNHDLTLCPSCGESGRPNTLDHYLPKYRYPHFCVTPINLFPMCDACQREKAEKTGDAAAPRFFLHPYFDVFIAQQVISLLVEPPYEAPTFRLVASPTLTAAQSALVVSHMRELRIAERYAHFFRGQNRRLLRLVDHMRTSAQDISANLTGFAHSAAHPTQNSWDHIFYIAVLSNVDWLDYLTNAALPPYL